MTHLPRRLFVALLSAALLAVGGPAQAQAFDVDDRISTSRQSGNLSYGFEYNVDWRGTASVALAGYTWLRWNGAPRTVCLQTWFSGRVTKSNYNSPDLPIDWGPLAESAGWLDGPPYVIVPRSQSAIYQHPYCWRTGNNQMVYFQFSTSQPVTATRTLAGEMSNVWVAARAGLGGSPWQPWTATKGALRGGA